MLKLFIGLLLLVNLGLYGYNAGLLGNGSLEGREPARMTNQINADRIRRVDPAPTAAPASAPARAAPATPVSTPTSPPAPNAALSAAAGPDTAAVNVAATGSAAPVPPTLGQESPLAKVTSNGASCIEVGNFDAADARRFEAQLAPLALGDALRRRSVQELERHIVYIPPAPDKEGADRKAAELRRLGIDDFYVIADNTDLRWGISLGIFKTVDAARLHLANLALKGVRTARIAARPGTNGKTAFQLRGLDAASRSTLAQIRLGFPRQDTRACPPA